MNKLKIYLTLILLCLLSGAKADDMRATPLTLEAVSDGSITFAYTLSLYHDAELADIEYQVNGGAWTTYTWNNAITVAAGDKVAFRGNNASYFGNGKGYESRITSTADVYVYGNVMSLINASDFATLTTLTGKDAFSHLFAVAGTDPWEVVPNTTIKNHPTKDLVLPATTLTNMCYMNMFTGCQGLTRAPELPATEMTVACYASMFEGCTNLTKAPALPTTTFTPYGQDPVTFEEYGSIDCYMMMFKDCTSLTEAPALPATTLVHGVYQNMFQGCTSLERAPELPAPIVADYAYSYMFDGCTSLNYVKCLATEFEINPEFGNTAEDNVMNWLNNVAATGTFVKAPSMNDWMTDSPNGIPAGWTVENYSAEPAKTAYAVQTQSNYYYLYFTYRSEKLEIGDSFTPEGSSSSETITGLWSGDEVTNYQGAPAWYSGSSWASKVIKVVIEPSFSNVKPKSGRDWFQGMSKILIFNGLGNLNTSEMTDMGFMFSGCKYSDLSAIANFNTSKVTDMEWMFQNCTFTSLDLSGWDVSKVTNMSNMFRGCSSVKTLNVAGWNTANVENMACLFYSCKLLKSLDLSSWNTSKITSMSSMFWNCNDLSTLTLGSGWDMSGVTTMEYMFYGCEDLGNALDVSSWNTANVTSMHQMFKGCTYLYSLDVSNWNTSKVTDMSYMFDGCQFINALDVSNWDTGNVTTMRCMFNNCYNLGALNVSAWNTSEVKNMSYMFSNCRALSTLNVSGWDTGKVGSMSNMFANCSTLATLNTSNWNMSLVRDVSAMFSGCNLLTAVDMSGLSSCSVSSLNSMFKDCKKLTSLNLRNLYTGNVTDMGSLFSGCTLLKDVYVSNLWQTRKVTTDADMFTGCTAIVGEDGTTYDDANVTKDYAHYAAGGYLQNGGDITFPAQPYAIYDADGKTVYLTYTDQMLVLDETFIPDGTSTPVTISNIWYGDAVITSVSADYSYGTAWTTNAYDATKVVIEPSFSQVRPTSTESWFAWMQYLETISGMENLITSDVTSMNGMFYGCYALTNVDVSHFDTQNVTDMGWMFAYCNNLKALDLSTWNTANVERMNVMFSDCGVKTLDLSSWNTSKVKTMTQMFTAYDLQAVFVGEEWTTAAVENPYDPVTQPSYQMFAYCTSIIGEDGTTYDEAAAKDHTVAHYGPGGLLRRHHDSYTVTIPASGVGSFSASENVTIPAGLTAHYCTTYDSDASTMSVTAISGNVIPAETGVLLRGTAGETYTLTATAVDGSPISNNALVAVTAPTHIEPTDGDYTNFMLKSGQFVRIAASASSSKMAANKAYLQIPTAALASSNPVKLMWPDDEATDVQTIDNGEWRMDSGQWYDLCGRKVGLTHNTPSLGEGRGRLPRGIYIRNGKKIVIK